MDLTSHNLMPTAPGMTRVLTLEKLAELAAVAAGAVSGGFFHVADCNEMQMMALKQGVLHAGHIFTR